MDNILYIEGEEPNLVNESDDDDERSVDKDDSSEDGNEKKPSRRADQEVDDSK